MSESIGARELRQNLSQVLKRVENGERIVVTSHNKAVAQIVPLHRRSLAQLIAEGKATPPKSGPPHSFRPIKLDVGDPLAGSKALDEMRRED